MYFYCCAEAAWRLTFRRTYDVHVVTGLDIPAVRILDSKTRHVYLTGHDKQAGIDMSVLRAAIGRLRLGQLKEANRINKEKPKPAKRLLKTKAKPTETTTTITAPAPRVLEPLPGIQYHTVLTGQESVQTVTSLFEEKELEFVAVLVLHSDELDPTALTETDPHKAQKANEHQLTPESFAAWSHVYAGNVRRGPHIPTSHLLIPTHPSKSPIGLN